jgi:L-histidine N-alpha-methyltransferase
MDTSKNAFAKEVKEGLSAPQKYLSSKYFYDAVGDVLFQKIMQLPEYYLTRAEFDILEQYRGDILRPLIALNEPFNLIEMGAGDGLKTRLLLSFLYEQKVPFTYYPIDISSNVLQQLQEALAKEYPGLSVEPVEGTYHEALEMQRWNQEQPSLMLFLGSNMGNFLKGEALGLLDEIAQVLRTDDMLLAGFDLMKDPEVILKAYNDSQGVTRDFNLNLLYRINRELGGNFDPHKFKHWPVYDPVRGECKSYLISMEKQTVHITALDSTFKFDEYEAIFTEVSKKYSVVELEKYAREKGFEVRQNYMDGRRYFTDSLWRKK